MTKTRSENKNMASEHAEIRNMIMFFRVSELQSLLTYAQCNRSGRKTELQTRALKLIETRLPEVIDKIREIYRTQSASLADIQTPSDSEIMDLQSSGSQRPITRSNMFQQHMQVSAMSDAMGNRNTNTHSNGVVTPYATNISGYPVHPDVRLKKLAFFDVLAILLKPATLVPMNNNRVQEGNFLFHLTPQQATDIASNRDIRNSSKIEHTIQVQLRFCLLETSCEQEDFFPPNVVVKVNNKQCQLPPPIPTNKPGAEPRRPPRPVNITSHVKLSPTVANQLTVSWCTEYNRGFAVTVYLVKKLTSAQLLHRLKTKGIKPADFTRGLIKEKLKEDADSEIATTMLRVSLICPLGKMRMITPARASTCSHLQCFDASLYLQMNERKATWNCPVCDKSAQYENLVIDGYFQEVLASSNLSSDDNEIQLNADGSWSTHIMRFDSQLLDTPGKNVVQKVEVISDDLEVITTDTPKNSTKQQNNNNEPTSTTNETVVDLTLSDSDDDDLPLKRNAANNGGGTSLNLDIKTNIDDMSSTSVISLDSPSPPSTPNPTIQYNQNSNSNIGNSLPQGTTITQPLSSSSSSVNNMNVSSTTSVLPLCTTISPNIDANGIQSMNSSSGITPNYQINPLSVGANGYRYDTTIEPVHPIALPYQRLLPQANANNWNMLNQLIREDDDQHQY